MAKNKHSLIRTIYLYLFALVGLALITIGTVRLVNLSLKTYVFKKADQQYYASIPPEPREVPGSEVNTEKLAQNCKENEELTEEQKELISTWLADYEDWQEKQQPNKRLASRRQRDASDSLAILLVGIPLFAYHWSVIKKETDKKEKQRV